MSLNPLEALSEKSFNSIIRENGKSFIKNSLSNVWQDEHDIALQSTIRKIIPNSECLTNSLPISTLGDFLISFKHNINIFTFIYFITVEISQIHSFNCYHGEISLDSIGVYYSDQTKSFYPSLILYYYNYKSNNKKQKNPESSKKSENLETNQNKDILSVFEIFKKLPNSGDINFDAIDKSGTMDMIVFDLYNKIYEKNDQSFFNDYNNFNYNNYKITKSFALDVFTNSNENDQIREIFMKKIQLILKK